MTDHLHPRPAPQGGLDPLAIETHVSLLVFAGDRAYKSKKAVRTPFLDFSTPELRSEACHREVELNRRFAPDVYLGVAQVLAPDGMACDSLVVMRRMPPDRRLSRLARNGDCEACLQATAELVAGFHRVAPTGPAIDQEGSRDAILSRWETNIEQLSKLAGNSKASSLPDRIASLARKYLAGRRPLFERRITEGRIRDGHGDLLADDIFCLDDGPRILDCLEFDDRLRYVDVLDEACFLAMDLERIAGEEMGECFLRAYRQASGEQYPESLSHHFRAYRAHVRAKVASMRLQQGDPQASDQINALLRIAKRHLEAGQVALILVGGLPGTGKSTVARGLAEEFGWIVLRSDEVRKEITGMPPSPQEETSYRRGIYRSEVSEATYRTLLARAQKLLEQGFSVILDASWSSARLRLSAGNLAQGCAAELFALKCEAPFEVAANRITERARVGMDPSDATPAVAKSMAAEFDPWPESATLSTAGELSGTLNLAGQMLRQHLTKSSP